jgi:23S rRNA (pseudouridine1915-N3)-methyltransferase
MKQRSPARLRILWPGRTRSQEWKALQEFYLARIRQLEPCELVEVKEAKGLEDWQAEKIMQIESKNLEKHLRDDYIICLFDRGKEMSSEELARHIGERMTYPRPTAFLVGGFAGLAAGVLERADLRLSLSRMTFSHELCRMALLEQIYRALTILKGKHYAK